MKNLLSLLCLFLLTASAASAQAMYRHKIALFTPLYLDSVFDAAGNVRLEKNNVPKYVSPGLEYYLGAQAALDSLQRRGAPLEVFVLDSRGRQSITQQLARPELRDVEMIIAQSNPAETRLLAEAALRRKIPFVSSTLPNDAGISNNPYFVVLNSTLNAHMESIYSFLQRNNPSDRIVVFSKPGAQEDQLRQALSDYGKNTTTRPLNIRFVDLGSAFSAQTIASSLDSTQRNVVIAGSLDEPFGNRLLGELQKLSARYPLRVIGMPTWERMNLSRLNNLEVIYTSPFFYNRSTPLESRLADDFTSDNITRPSDLYFRGYESTLRFALLLLDTKKDVASNLTRKGNTVFTNFDIQPVFKNKNEMTLDYFENRHLYFIKVMGGSRNVIY